MRPPKWPATLLERLCDPELFDEIVGDLDEMYDKWVEEFGTRKANRLYILHTIKFVRPFIFRKTKKHYSANVMTLNYFRIALRNIVRNKAFAAINIVGLSLGLTCSIVIYALVSHHLSFDNFHGDLSSTYRFVVEAKNEGINYSQWVPQPLGKAFANDYAFADKVARTRDYSSVMISLPEDKDNKKFKEDRLFSFAEPAFFEIFNFPIIVGSASEIKEPNTALVTREMAIKYFGSEDAVNKVIRVNSQGTIVDFRIVGVLQDFPVNSHFTRKIFVSYQNLKDFNAWYASDESWGSFNSGMQCFVKLKPHVTKVQVDEAMQSLVKKYYDEDDGSSEIYSFFLQPMSEVHLDTQFGASFSEKNIWTLSVTGFLMLLIACINFINLATAQVLNRSKEVGVRKILGSLRMYIFMQFMVETGVIASLSVAVACLLSYLLLPFLNTLLNENLVIHFFDQWQVPVFLFSILIIVVLASGVYPAMLLTRFQPSRVLKDKLSNSSGLSLRRVLITTQFVVSQVLIICIIVIESQMSYSLNTDLGFEKDAIVMISSPQPDATKMKTLKARIEQLPGVQDVSLCFDAPGTTTNVETSVRYNDHEKDEPWDINLKEIDENYLRTFDLQLVAGRNIVQSDSLRDFLVNETFVKKLGIASPQEVIGKMLHVNGGTMNARIEGVVKDFYMYSFHDPITPTCFAMDYSWFRNYAVKVDITQSQEIVAKINAMWSETYPDNIFAYEFLDERVEKFYKADQAMFKLVQIAAFVAIVISCLGLYGMVSFMAVRKTKEIGIRKVLGAGVTGIVWLFAREFAMLIGIAFIVAAPVAWTAMDKWLAGFAYHISLSPLSFVVAIGCTLLIAALTVSYHSIRSAVANPVKSLRTE